MTPYNQITPALVQIRHPIMQHMREQNYHFTLIVHHENELTGRG